MSININNLNQLISVLRVVGRAGANLSKKQAAERTPVKRCGDWKSKVCKRRERAGSGVGETAREVLSIIFLDFLSSEITARCVTHQTPDILTFDPMRSHCI